MPRPTGDNENMLIDCYGLGNAETLTVFFAKTLKEYITDFVDMGLYASKGEFVRAAIQTKVIKTLKRIEIMKKWKDIKDFNESRKDVVKVPEEDLSFKTYKIERRLE